MLSVTDIIRTEMGGLTFLDHPMIFVTKQNEEYSTEDAADRQGRSCCPSVAAGMSLQSDCHHLDVPRYDQQHMPHLHGPTSCMEHGLSDKCRMGI